VLNIVIPMAGRGSRFANVGYEMPKPLIDVHGKPMIERVIDNLTPDCNHRFIFIVLEEHINEYKVDKILKSVSNNCEIVPINSVTEGAACTVLLAEKFIDDNPLMIANSDQWVNYDINNYINYSSIYDGMIMTMYADDPKWSFIAFEDDLVTEVVEKRVISNEATVGIYNFSNGTNFIDAAKKMIKKDLRVNGEFYVAPVFNEMIESEMKIGYKNIDSDKENVMFGLGTPEDLEVFLADEISQKML
tara:strand:+ start:296 stop:1033 length:738 start_codon:yes stop_codon:yes gene_type:complete